MDINTAAKEYGNGVITSLKKNRRILIMMLLFAAGSTQPEYKYCENDNRRGFSQKG